MGNTLNKSDIARILGRLEGLTKSLIKRMDALEDHEARLKKLEVVVGIAVKTAAFVSVIVTAIMSVIIQTALAIFF